jgi:hypothetical protein
MTTVTYDDWRENRMCRRKRGRYDTKVQANAVVLRIWQDGRDAKAYECEFCGSWHVTTQGEGATT